MKQTETTVIIDGTKYKWIHDVCFCFNHCYSDHLFVDDEPMGSFNNTELCSFIKDMANELRIYKEKLDHEIETRLKLATSC